MGIDRATVIGKIRIAFREGMSASTFINEMKEIGLSYRRTDMLADFRSVNELESKADLFKYVRKDYYPTEKTIAQVGWELSREYLYKVKVSSRISPGEPLTERFVNIMSDIPMTPGMVEQATVEMFRTWEQYIAEQVQDIVPWTAVHKVME